MNPSGGPVDRGHLARRVLGLATLAINVALFGVIMSGADTSDWVWIPFAVWMLAPTLLPYALASIGRPRRWFVITMLATCVVSASIAGFAYFEAFHRAESSTAGLIAIFMPVYQFAALLAVLAGCAVFGWFHRGYMGAADILKEI